jgi:hypothetical protein
MDPLIHSAEKGNGYVYVYSLVDLKAHKYSMDVVIENSVRILHNHPLHCQIFDSALLSNYVLEIPCNT